MKRFGNNVVFGQSEATQMPPSILIFGLSPQGLFLLREYARLGLNVVAIARKEDVGIKSKYGKIIIMHNDNELISLINDVVGDGLQDCQAIITSDYFLKLLCNDHPEMFDAIPFRMSQLKTLKLLSNKQATYEEAKRLNILVPETLNFEQCHTIKTDSFPLILKWNETPIGVPIPFKTLQINDHRALMNAWEAYAPFAPFLILQKVIVGVDLSYAGYFDHGKEVFACVTQKGRQFPLGISSYISDPIEPNAEQCRPIGRRFMESQLANGFIEVEFRLSEAGSIYLIEVNPRIWGWAKFLRLKILNFHTVLLDTQATPSYNPNFCKWFNLLRDLRALVRSLKRGRKSVALRDFVRSYQGTKIFDVFELRDLGPFLYQLYKGL